MIRMGIEHETVENIFHNVFIVCHCYNILTIMKIWRVLDKINCY